MIALLHYNQDNMQSFDEFPFGVEKGLMDHWDQRYAPSLINHIYHSLTELGLISEQNDIPESLLFDIDVQKEVLKGYCISLPLEQFWYRLAIEFLCNERNVTFERQQRIIDNIDTFPEDYRKALIRGLVFDDKLWEAFPNMISRLMEGIAKLKESTRDILFEAYLEHGDYEDLMPHISLFDDEQRVLLLEQAVTGGDLHDLAKQLDNNEKAVVESLLYTLLYALKENKEKLL